MKHLHIFFVVDSSYFTEFCVAVKKVQNSFKFYNSVSFLYNPLLNWIFDSNRKKVADQLNQHPNKTILDIGCGTGEILKFINKDIPYMGIDPAEKMIAELKKKFPNRNAKVQNLESFTSTKKYDQIILLYTISTVNDLSLFLEKIKLHLASNGNVYIVNHFSSRSWFYRLLQNFSINFGYNAYFPLNTKDFEKCFSIVNLEDVGRFKNWKLIQLQLKDE